MVFKKSDILDLDLKLLVAFEAVLTQRNVTAAAQSIGLTQPAMSTALGKLRRVFKDPLFVRTSRGMEPTPFAMQLAEPIRHALHLIRQTLNREKTFDAGTSTRTFRIVMTDIGERVFLPALLQRLSAIAPGVNVHTVQLPVKEMREALESGQMDLAIGFIPDLAAGFISSAFSSAPMSAWRAATTRRSATRSRSSSTWRRHTPSCRPRVPATTWWSACSRRAATRAASPCTSRTFWPFR